MRMRFCLVLVWAVTRSGWGADEKLPVLQAGGEVYSNVTVTAVSATDVFFTHDQGMGNAKLKDLSPGIRIKGGKGHRAAGFNLTAPDRGG